MTAPLKNWPQPEIISLGHKGFRLAPWVKKNKPVGAGQLLGESASPEGRSLRTPLSGLILEVTAREIIIGRSPGGFGQSPEPLEMRGLSGSDLASALRSLGVPLGQPNPLEPLIVSLLDEEPGLDWSQTLFRQYHETLAAAIDGLEKIWPEREIIFVGPPELKLRPGHKFMPQANRYPLGLKGLVKKKALGHFDPQGTGVFSGRDLFFIGRALLTGWPVREMPLSLNGAGYLAAIGSRVIDLLEFAHLSPRPGQSVVLGGLLRGRAIARLEQGLDIFQTAVHLVDNPPRPSRPRPCRRCLACSLVCPMGIPMHLLAEIEYEKWPSLNLGAFLDDCLDCGLCAQNCPVQRPLRELTLQRPAEEIQGG